MNGYPIAVCARWFGRLAFSLAVFWAPAPAQEAASGPEALPGVPDLARALADPATHEAALLASAALAAQARHRAAGTTEEAAGPAERLYGDREWLEALQSRFGTARPRSPVLDPSAWRLRLQLEQHGLEAGAMFAARGPGQDVLLDQVFDRGSPRLAAAALPELLWHMEAGATFVLNEWLTGAESDARQAVVLRGFAGLWQVPADAAADWPEPAPPDRLLADAAGELAALAAESSGMGPPDPRRLRDLRYTLLVSMHLLGPPERQAAGIVLHLAGLLDGLNDNRYFHFVEGLLGSVAQLDRLIRAQPGRLEWLGATIAEMLPAISNHYSRALADVDPRLNSALAAAYDAVRNLTRPERGGEAVEVTRQLADAVAMLAMLVPDMDYYFGLPVRDPIVGVVDACTGIIASREADGSPAITRELFDDCLQGLLELADGAAREAQLAGDPDGPFGEQHLQRELGLAFGQRINYGIGFLHDRYATGCEAPQRALPNPLEWAFLATFMTWFAEQSPVYFQTPENERRLTRVRAIGLDLLRDLSEQLDCFAGAGAGVNDPVSRVIDDYRGELVRLVGGLRRAEAEVRARYLAPGADVSLDGTAGQSTAYRPDNLPIGPCDLAQVCEMSGQLSSTRALLGLFPEPFLLADQTRLGRVEICYDRMEWVDRRSEPVRSGDANVANFYGHLAFDLRGRYHGQGGPVDLFAFRFRTPEEQHYMFAAASQDVLDDSCPVEWIGSRIVTELPAGRRGIVPNRLTYLSASRTLPSRLLARNWDRGAEWRDWFVTGIGVEELPLEPAVDITPQLNEHLGALHRTVQQAVYGTVLRNSPAPGMEGLTPLFDDLVRLTVRKTLLRSQMLLFYPQALIDSDDFRRAVAGHGGLLDSQVLGRMRDANVPVAQAVDRAHEQLDQFRELWRAQPESMRRSGSAAATLSHALIRLNAVYTAYFSTPAGAQPAPAADVPD